MDGQEAGGRSPEGRQERTCRFTQRFTSAWEAAVASRMRALAEEAAAATSGWVLVGIFGGLTRLGGRETPRESIASFP